MTPSSLALSTAAPADRSAATALARSASAAKERAVWFPACSSGLSTSAPPPTSTEMAPAQPARAAHIRAVNPA